MNIFFKQKHIARLLFAIILFNFLFFNVPQANAWETWLSTPMGVMLKEMLGMVQGVLIGAAKKAALMAMEKEINFAITGNSSGGAMFITNWNTTLSADPEAKARATMTKFIASMTSGKGGSGYIPNISIGAKFGNNYEGVGSGSLAYGLGGINAVRAATGNGSALAGQSYAQHIQKIATDSLKNNECQLTYAGRLPNETFIKDLNRNIDNSGWKKKNCVEQKLAEEIAKEQDVARTQAISYQGGKGTEVKDGNVTTITNPGSLIIAAKAGVQNIGGQIIAAANNLPEILTAVATQMMTQSITQGIGDMQAKVHSEISDVRNKANAATNSAVTEYGPGALYKQ